MLELLAHLLMWTGGIIAILAVSILWLVLMIAIFDTAADPTIQSIKNHPLIRNITTKIEEYRNARS